MFQVLLPLFRALQPFLVPICFVSAWVIILMLVWTVGSAIIASVTKAKIMHKIPCSGCEFFTNDYRLKCTIHPAIANTETAINCSDYCPRRNSLSIY